MYPLIYGAFTTSLLNLKFEIVKSLQGSELDICKHISDAFAQLSQGSNATPDTQLEEFGAVMKRKRATKLEPKRSEIISYRVTPEEYLRLQLTADSAGMSVNEFARNQAVKGKVLISEQPRPMDTATLIQLKRIGTNLNQIARAVNSDLPLPLEFRRVCTIIEDAVMKAIDHDNSIAQKSG